MISARWDLIDGIKNRKEIANIKVLQLDLLLLFLPIKHFI